MSYLAKTGLKLANVKDFGAQGDDATDDTVAIQTAINSAISSGEDGVFFPPGNYLVNLNGLQVNAQSFRFTGAGKYISTLQFIAEDHLGAARSLLNIATGSADVQIDNVGLDGNKNLVTNTNVNTALIQVDPMDGFTLVDSHLANSEGVGVSVGNNASDSVNVLIRGNQFTNNFGDHMRIDTVSDTVIESNNVIGEDAGSIFVRVTRATRIKIDQNVLANTGPSWRGIAVTSATDIRITNNEILDPSALEIVPIVGIDLNSITGQIFNVDISGNNLALSASTNAIQFNANAGGPIGGRISVRNNILDSGVGFSVVGGGTYTSLPYISDNTGNALSLQLSDTVNFLEPAFIIGGSLSRGFSTNQGGNTYLGEGNPEGFVSGFPGDIFRSTFGGTGLTLFVKESGSGTTTGWVALTGNLVAANQNNYEVFATLATPLALIDTIIPMDVEESAKAGFALAGGRVTVGFTGRVKVCFSVSADATTGTRSISRSTINLNGVAVLRGFADGYHRTAGAGENTVGKMVLLDVTNGDILDVRSRLIAGVVTTTALGCNLLIERIN